MRRMILTALLAVLVLASTACTNRLTVSKTANGGRELTAEGLESIRNTVLNAETETNTPPDGRFYWTASATVYHLYADCSKLGDTVLSSDDRFDAYRAGKINVCSVCQARAEIP